VIHALSVTKGLSPTEKKERRKRAASKRTGQSPPTWKEKECPSKKKKEKRGEPVETTEKKSYVRREKSREHSGI